MKRNPVLASIDRLTVRNFKSLESLELELPRLVFLVGPNNSGKSNILDSLIFVSDFVRFGHQAIGNRVGFRNIVWGGDTSRKIEIEIEAALKSGEDELIRYIYRIELEGSAAYCTLAKEDLTCIVDGGRWIALEYDPRAGMAEVRDSEGKVIGKTGHGADRPYIGDFRDPVHYKEIAQLVNMVWQFRFYDFVPPRMGQPNQAKRESYLQGQGENLSGLIHSIQSEHRQEFLEMEKILRNGIPEIEHIHTALTDEGYTYISLQEKHLPGRIPGWAASDGILRILGLLAISYSPEHPSLVCIEEPENELHPHLLELAIDVIRPFSKRCQVIATTHSPHLLNHVPPEALFITEKTQGRTQCKRVTDRAGVSEALKVLGLGEMWYSGSLGGTP